MGLLAREPDAATTMELTELRHLAERRLKGAPVARLLGEQEFWGLAFALSAATLVPRPETEMVVEHGLAFLRSEAATRPAPRLLDLGTGTGCIPIALLVELPQLSGVAVDLSADALATAAANAERHGVAARLSLREGSWFAPLAETERFDLVTSNPPYIETAALAGLMPEVREHDPQLALDGGEDGLAAYRVIAAGAKERLLPGGRLLLEIGTGQGRAVAALLAAAGFAGIVVHPDLAGHERLVVADRP